MRRALALFLLVLAASLVATASRAADDDTADAALARGVALRRQLRDEEALAEFRRAYTLGPSARALAQIALAEAALQQWVDAERDLLRALAESDPWIDRQRGALQAAVGEVAGHLGSLEVEGPEGAEIWIDGALAGRIPAPRLRVNAKHLVVELRAAGFEPSRGEVDVKPAGLAHIALSLAAAPVVSTAAPPRRDAKAQTTWAWASAGAAAVFLAGGVAATVYAANQSAHYNDDSLCGDLPGGPTRSERCGSYATHARTGEALEVIGYVSAGVAAATSAVLVLTLPSVGPAQSAWCAPGVGGVACGARF